MQKRQNKHPDPTPWLFLAPSLCGVTLFVLAPFVETVRRSVTDTMGRCWRSVWHWLWRYGRKA